MKKSTLISATLFAAGILYIGGNFANAQSKLSFGLNIGYTAPSGDFISTEASKQPVLANNSKDTGDIAGYAKGGFHFDVYGTYMFTPIIGGMVSIGGSMNGYDIATLNSNIEADYIANGGYGTIPAFTNSGNYYVGQYLIGPYIKLSASDKIKVELKALFGLTAINYPDLSYSYSFGGAAYSETSSVKSTSGFGYNVGAGVIYQFTDMLGFHFNVSYGGCSVSYPSYSVSESSGGSSLTETHNNPLAMSVGLIEVTVGASVNL